MHNEMRMLCDRLNEASRRYYQGGEPIMSDAQWDALYEQLQALERSTGVVLDDSPSHRIGGEPLAAFRQHRHLAPLWSMDKVQSEAGLLQWFERLKALLEKNRTIPSPVFCVENKFDGLTINLTYRQGLLVHAATRGNGTVGEEILPQARTIRGIPLSIAYQGTMEVHGECIMKLSDFTHYNKTTAEPLKNARNAAAGALRNLDPRVTASRRLSAYFYEVGYIDDAPYTDEEGLLAFLRENGFPVSPLLSASADEQDAINAIRALEINREHLDYLIDGAVIKISDRATRRYLGYTDKFPRWAVAYKFEAEENISVLEHVSWEIGRSGKLTPLAHVEAVDFSGVTVRKATLNNFGDILRKKLKLGARIWIRRSNDVIPEIMGVVEEDAQGREIEKPARCPACGTELVETGANLFCPNWEGCKPQVIARLVHFAGRDAMDIAAFSEKTAELFYDKLEVREVDDLYRLSKEQLLTLPGFLQKRADNYMEAIAASKACTLDAFLFAIGIPGIGRGTARDIATHFGTLASVSAANPEELGRIEGVGEVLAQSILAYFADERTRGMIGRLLELGVHPHPMQQAGHSAVLDRSSVVVTGTLPSLSRQEAEELIRQHGGVASGSVSRKTTFLLAGENAGSKLQKAQELGIPILNEAAFLRMLEPETKTG